MTGKKQRDRAAPVLSEADHAKFLSLLARTEQIYWQIVRRRLDGGYGLERSKTGEGTGDYIAGALRLALDTQPNGDYVQLPRFAAQALADHFSGKLPARRGRGVSVWQEAIRGLARLEREQGRSVAEIARSTGQSEEAIRDWTEADGRRMAKKRERSRRPRKVQ